jgi:glutamate/tyrosine decarboxylase-like PLP-dependent enzyme
LPHDRRNDALCFRVVPAGYPADRLNELQENVYRQILAGGRRCIGVTKLDDLIWLRVVVVSPTITSADLVETVVEIRRLSSLC